MKSTWDELENGLDGLVELRAHTLAPHGCSLKQKVAKKKANRANILSRQMKPSGEPETNFHPAFCLRTAAFCSSIPQFEIRNPQSRAPSRFGLSLLRFAG